ncbi:hypothetical protein BKA82DRAFT_11558 [Pisolithus tinctorius]|uniref:Uncharacterized protein n=1 Tax=Pisolithus tinctorius Marx 270 TaxID=870435 RepID=A0A0C3I6F9_PISTI|nr:hypothetical protein BKA82DRAFT_11558 [Pisolithus tinctorius]KIN92787.1 hypothetical protein M404DRAFT_11558 [Pisolithus tinctorius Marx 270]
MGLMALHMSVEDAWFGWHRLYAILGNSFTRCDKIKGWGRASGTPAEILIRVVTIHFGIWKHRTPTSAWLGTRAFASEQADTQVSQLCLQLGLFSTQQLYPWVFGIPQLYPRAFGIQQSYLGPLASPSSGVVASAA